MKLNEVSRKITVIIITICLVLSMSFKDKRNDINAVAVTGAAMTSAVIIAMTFGLGIKVVIDSGLIQDAAKGISEFAATAYQGAVSIAQGVKDGFAERFNASTAKGRVTQEDMALFTTSLAAYLASQGVRLGKGISFNMKDLRQSNLSVNLMFPEYVQHTAYNGGNYSMSKENREKYGDNYIMPELSSITGKDTRIYLPGNRSALNSSKRIVYPRLAFDLNETSVPMVSGWQTLFPDFDIRTMTHSLMAFAAGDIGLNDYPVLIPGQLENSKSFQPKSRPLTQEDMVIGVYYPNFPLDILADRDYEKENYRMEDGKNIKYVIIDNGLFLPLLKDNYDREFNQDHWSGKKASIWTYMLATGWGVAESGWGLKGSQTKDNPKSEAEASERFDGLLLPGLGGLAGAIAIPKNPSLPGIDTGVIENPEDIATEEEWEDVGFILPPISVPVEFPQFPDIDWAPPSVGDMITGGIIGSLLAWLGGIIGGLIGWIGELISYGFIKIFEWFGKVLTALGNITGVTSVLNSIFEFLKSIGIVISEAITSAFNWAFTLDQVKFKVAWENLVNVVELKLPLFFDLISLFTGLFVAKSTNPPDFKITVPSNWGGGTYSVFSVALLDPYIGLIRTTISIFIWLWWGWRMTKKLSHFFNK